MKTYIEKGKEITVAAPSALLSGDLFAVGALILVAAKNAASGELVAGSRVGVFSLPKLSTDVVAVGDKLNWNGTNKNLQKATSTLDGVATAVAVAGSGATKVLAVLTPV